MLKRGYFSLLLLFALALVSVLSTGDRGKAPISDSDSDAPLRSPVFEFHDQIPSGIPLAQQVQGLPVAQPAMGMKPGAQSHHVNVFDQPSGSSHATSFRPLPEPGASQSVQSSVWQIRFPPTGEPPILDRSLAGVVAANTYGGTSNHLPPGVFEDASVRSRLMQWSLSLMSDPLREVRFNFARHGVRQLRGEVYHDFIYLYHPISPQDFMWIFPRATVDWSRVIPLVAFRARVPQPHFLRHGNVDIAGVEMVTDIKHLMMDGPLSKGRLVEALDRIERGP